MSNNTRTDKVAGHLLVGVNEHCEVVINHGEIRTDKNGVGHIVFSTNQARMLAAALLKQAAAAEEEWHKRGGR